MKMYIDLTDKNNSLQIYCT